MKIVFLSALFAATAFAAPSNYPTNTTSGPDENGKYEISAEGIRGLFIPYGASISNLFIKGKDGVERDIVLGYDNASYYSIDPVHPHFGGVPGRYANRIKNSTFNIDGVDYHITPNENGGADTLHGGLDGWGKFPFLDDSGCSNYDRLAQLHCCSTHRVLHHLLHCGS
jgi:aldose 1-epimerase